LLLARALSAAPRRARQVAGTYFNNANANAIAADLFKDIYFCLLTWHGAGDGACMGGPGASSAVQQQRSQTTRAARAQRAAAARSAHSAGAACWPVLWRGSSGAKCAEQQAGTW
jgi:hypothetical protein